MLVAQLVTHAVGCLSNSRLPCHHTHTDTHNPNASWPPAPGSVAYLARYTTASTHLAALPYSLQVPNGPGMIIFSPNGKYAYVCSSFTPETVVIDTASYDTVARIKQASTFCPNIAATPDGSQVGF